MRTYGYNGSPKATAASTTVTFTQADMPNSGISKLLLVTGPATNINSDITRIRVKAGGSTIYDLTGVQLSNFIERTSKANVGTYQAAACQNISIPFCDLLQPTADLQDEQQFPYGQPPTVEIVGGAGWAAGFIYLGWVLTNVRPRWYPRLLSQGHGIAATAVNGRMAFNEPGDFRGFCIPTGTYGTPLLNRVRCVANGQELLNLPGGLLGTVTGDMLGEAQRTDGNGLPTATPDPTWIILDSGAPALAGHSFFEVDQTGAAAAGEICIYGRSPQ